MPDALSIALTGLTAQGLRLAAAASNIANAGTTGVLPTAASPTSTVYRPLSVSYIALGAGGGVRAEITPDANGYSAVYDPTSVYANSEGLIAAPNIDLVRETVSVLESKLLFKANITTLKAQKEMLGEILDVIS